MTVMLWLLGFCFLWFIIVSLLAESWFYEEEEQFSRFIDFGLAETMTTSRVEKEK